MHENTKRLLTLVMAVSMLLSMMPISVSAQEQTTETPTDQQAVEALPELDTEIVNAVAMSNSPDTATPLSLDTWYDAVISEQGQKVYFSFTPEESGIYMMRADVNTGVLVDLFDANNNSLGTGYGGNSLGSDSLVYNELTAGQTYYYAVSFSYAEDISGTIPVLLSYRTLTNLEFEPISLIENTDGWLEQDALESYYYYEPNFFLANYQCTATFSDGTTLTSSGDGFTYNGLYYGIWGYTDQSEETPWTVGNTYTMEVSCMGLTFNVPVSIVPSPVVSLEIAPITVMENTRGVESTYWDQETETSIPFHYYVEWQLMHETSFTATLSDGTVITSNTHYFEYNGKTCYLQLETNQYDAPWTVGNTYYMTVSMLGTTVEVPVTIIPIPLVSLEFTPVSVIENTTGGMSQDWNPDTQQNDRSYYHYSTWNILNKSTYTATFNDGTVLEGSGYGLEYNGKWYDFSYYSEQNYENPWTVGNTYNISVTLMEKTVDLSVSIIPSPVVSLEIAPISVVKNTCGEQNSYWDNETQTEVSYYHYREWQLMWKTSFTATLNDGTVLTGNKHHFDYNGETYYMDCTSTQATEHWTVGNTYTMQVTMLGKTVEVPVTITDIPVIKLESTNTWYNADISAPGQKVFFSFTPTESGTYIFRSNTEEDTYCELYDADDALLESNDDGGSGTNFMLSYALTAGQTYYYAVEFLDSYNTGTIPVILESSPLVSLEFTPVSVVENTCGYEDHCWNEETQSVVSYFNYYIWDLMYKSTYTATFNDGTVLTGSGSELEYNGQWYDFEYSNTQSYENQWTVGNTYSTSITLMGTSAELSVTITPVPLVSLEFTPVTIMEGTNGEFYSNYDPENFQNYYRYNIWNALEKSTYTATFSDGTVLTGSGSGLDYNGEWYSFNEALVSQTFENPWTAGNSYYFAVGCMGKIFQLPVTIEASPLVSLAVDPITVIENTCGSWNSYYDGEQEVEYYYYSAWQLLQQSTYTLTFSDGTVQTGSGSGFWYNGEWYSLTVSSTQGFYDQWTAGNTYTMQVSTLGKSVDVPVTICKSPIVSVEFEPIMLAENQDGYWNGYWGESGYVEYFHYNWQNSLRYTVTMEDGSTVTGNQHGFTYNNIYYDVSMDSDQSWENPWLAGNTYAVTVNFPGYEAQAAVTVCTANTNNGYSYIVQNGKVIITDCYLEDEVIQIPDTIDGNTVVGITYLGFALDYALELTIPDSVTMLSEDVFGIWGYYEYVNIPLQKLHLGSGISNMSPDMLMWCSNLEQITVSADNETYCSVDGVLYNKDCTEMIVYPFGKTTHHVIPDTVEYIDVIFEYGDNYKAISYQLGSGVKDYAEVDGVIYTKDMTQVVATTARATGNYVMPESVTDIRKLAFANSQLTSVTVSPNVTSITYAAFLGSAKLESITLPANLEAIEMLAFDSCTSLQSIEIPASVIYIGSSAFYDCCSLTGVYADSLDSWCSIYFEGSDANPLKFAEKLYIDGQLLTDLVIPNVSDLVYDYAFYNAQLNSITVPEYVYYIGYSSFYGTTAQTLTLTENLECINPKAFAYSNIQSVTLPDSLRYLGYQAFYRCEDLQSLTIGNQLVEIGSDSFAYTGLTSVVLPENIEYVGSCAFQNSQLTEVTFNCASVYIGDNAFENCPLGDLDLQENIQGFEYEAFAGTLATKVNIPSTVTGLTYREFAFSYNLVSVTIPDSVEHIGDECFRGDVNLSHVLYTGTEEQWNNMAIGSQEILDAMVHFEANGDEVTTQQTCTQVSFYCSICDAWETVNKIKANHNMVDGTCTVCGHVGDWEYQVDETANTVTITGYSGKNSYLEIPETIQGMPVVAIAPNAFANISGIYTVVLPDSLEEIGESAFEDAPHLYKVSFGENLKVIGDYAFAGCENLSTVKLPEGLEVIGNGAFDSCYWLWSINIPESVTTIGDYAFDGCYHLQSIELPQGLTRIGDYSFYGTLIECIDIPDTVTEIGYGAFQWCDRLESVAISANVTSISYDAFSENFMLHEIIFKGNAPEIAPIAFTGVVADVYYDLDNDTWTEDVLQNYNGELCWIGCITPRITKQLKDVYADETGLATVSCEAMGVELIYNWYGAMPGENFELLSRDYGSFSMQIDESNSGYSIYCVITDALGRAVTTKTVTMKLAPTMTGIEITKLPNKVEYDLNQGLRTTGMVVMGHYSDGTKMEITNYQITGYRADQSGEQTITVAYGGFTDTYTVTVKEDVLNFTNTEQKVEISAPAGAIDTDTQLVVEQIDIFEEVPVVPDVIEQNAAVVFDVSLEKDGETVQPTQDVEVSIAVPEGMTGTGCKVYYVDNEGNAEDMEARFEDGFMVFTVPHFSYYAIVQMPGRQITGQLTGAETATVNLKQGDQIVHTTQAEDGIYNFLWVAEGTYTLEVIADGLDAYITEIIVGAKDIAKDVLLLILGDFTGDGEVTNQDVIHLLWHTLFPDIYTIVGNADFTGDGEVTNQDVIHLLWHTLFPDIYPLN